MCNQETEIKFHLFAKNKFSLTLGDLIEKLNQPVHVSCTNFCHVCQKALVLTVQNSLNMSPIWFYKAHAESKKWLRPEVYMHSWIHLCTEMNKSLSTLLKMWIVFLETWTNLKKIVLWLWMWGKSCYVNNLQSLPLKQFCKPLFLNIPRNWEGTVPSFVLQSEKESSYLSQKGL